MRALGLPVAGEHLEYAVSSLLRRSSSSNLRRIQQEVLTAAIGIVLDIVPIVISE